MDHLATRDLSRLLEYGRAFEAPGLLSPAVAVDRLLVAIADLVPGDVAVISVSSGEPRTSTVWATDAAVAYRRTGAQELWDQCVERREHPVVSYHVETGDRRAMRLSDFTSPLALRRTTLFDYFWRPFGIRRTMGGRIETPTRNVYLASYRTGQDFSERDRTMLDGLRAHAGRFMNRAEVAPLAVTCQARFGLTAREAEIIVWATRGRTVPGIASLLVLSPLTVKAHLRNIYSKTGWRSRAVASAEVYAATVRDEGAPGPNGAQLGLTSRETEVILGVARGWTNARSRAPWGCPWRPPRRTCGTSTGSSESATVRKS